MRNTHVSRLVIGAVLVLFVSCLALEFERGPRHGWWAGLGPVLPHDSFPADCRSCHLPESWTDLVPEFAFDHEARTGVPLAGAHASAQCLRCHNDRGPVDVFASQGCVGCHEDVHLGQLGDGCTKCHTERTWQPVGQIALHDRTRFPLVGIHASVSCRRCHPGSEVGVFLPQDTECVSCHAKDLAGANNPDHLALGFVNRCDSCHRPTYWRDAELDVDFASAASAEPSVLFVAEVCERESSGHARATARPVSVTQVLDITGR